MVVVLIHESILQGEAKIATANYSNHRTSDLGVRFAVLKAAKGESIVAEGRRRYEDETSPPLGAYPNSGSSSISASREVAESKDQQ